MVKIIILGIITVLISTNLKAVNMQYSTYIGVVACIIIAAYGLTRMKSIIEMIDKMLELMDGKDGYVKLIVKVAGLNYAGEFAVGICKDAGHQAVANQIEIAQRITILAISLPILQKLIELIGGSL